MAIVTLLYLAYIALPIMLLLVGSFGAAWTNTLLPTGVTFAWYEQIWHDRSFIRAFTTSVEVVLATCVLGAAITTPLAYALFRAESRIARVGARLIAVLPIGAPPLVLGFGFILVFSSDTLPWLGSIWLLIAGQVVLVVPYLLQSLLGDMRHLNLAQLEQAAESLGAPFWRRFFDIVVPSLAQSLTSSTIMVAALTLGEFQLSNLVAGFLSRPYPVVLLQAFYGATGFACAATVVLLMLALVGAIGTAIAGKGAKQLESIA